MVSRDFLVLADAVIDLVNRVANRYDAALPFFSEFGRLWIDNLSAPQAHSHLLDEDVRGTEVGRTRRYCTHLHPT